MKIYKTLLAVFVSATCAFGSSTVDQLKFIEISGASKGITIDSLAVADSDALTLGPGGSVARIGMMPQGLRFDIEKIGVVTNVLGARSISATPEYFIVGGELGGLAVGRISQSGINWQNASIATSNSVMRVATLGGNFVAITGSRKTFYGSTSNLNFLVTSDIQGGSFLETYNNVVGFSAGDGAIVGNGGVIRYSSNSGATFVNARSFGSSTVSVTDAAKLDGRLYATLADGSVLSSDIPSDLSKSPAGWNWQSVNVSGPRALRSIAIYGDQLVVVGDGGAAYYLKGTNWIALENLPASAKSANLIAVKSATRGQFHGTALIASASSIYLGTPIPKAAVLLSVAALETCSSNSIPAGKTFLATPAADALDKFVHIDWLSASNRFRINTNSLPLFESRTGIFKYQAVARDYRSGVESVLTEVTHQVFQNPAAPVAERSVYEQCASELTAKLAVNPGPAGTVFRWYATVDALTNLYEGPLFEVPATTNTVYFVEAVDTNHVTCCQSVTRTPVELKVFQNPAAPVAKYSIVEACASQLTAKLAVNPGSAGTIFRWYATVDALTNLYEGLQFVVPATTNTVYFVEAVDTNHVTCCRSVTRTPVELKVFQNPAAPVAELSVYEQCASERTAKLAVNPGSAGTVFRWYATVDALTNLYEGLQVVVPATTNIVYFVEAVDTNHVTCCQSVTRTPVELKINPLPDAPKVASTNLSILACEDLPKLAVQAVPGVKFAWYDDASGGVAVSTNVTFMPTAKVTKIYYVEAISEITGCISSTRTPVSLTVRPEIQLAAKDVVVPYGNTNTSVVLKVGVTPNYESYHTSTWRGMGDGGFADANSFSTTYVPGTNDLASGIVKVNLEVVDSLAISGSGLLCNVKTASFRIIYAKTPPSLKISVDENGVVEITWPPAPGYQLVANKSFPFTDDLVVSDGEKGSHTISAEEGVRFYRLKSQ